MRDDRALEQEWTVAVVERLADHFGTATVDDAFGVLLKRGKCRERLRRTRHKDDPCISRRFCDERCEVLAEKIVFVRLGVKNVSSTRIPRRFEAAPCLRPQSAPRGFNERDAGHSACAVRECRPRASVCHEYGHAHPGERLESR
jgi:hypothetical protein